MSKEKMSVDKLNEELNKVFHKMEDDIATRVGGPGWVYRDVPLTTKLNWERLLGIIGEGNYKIIIMSVDRKTKDTRGQLVISPTGIEMLQAFYRTYSNATHLYN